MSVEHLDLERVRDLEGRGAHPWYRRGILALMLVFVLAGLTGVFGQVQHDHRVSTPGALVVLRAPEALRGGLSWPAQIRVEAHRRLAAPVVVLGTGYLRGMQLNTVEPAPAQEASRGGRVALIYPTMEPGDVLTVHLQLQVNPTTVGRQDLGVRLEADGLDEPARIPLTVPVLP